METNEKFYEIILTNLDKNDGHVVWEKKFCESAEQVLARNCYRQRHEEKCHAGQESGMDVHESGISIYLYKDDDGAYLCVVYEDGSFTGSLQSYTTCFIGLGEEKDIYTEYYRATFGEIFDESRYHYKVAFRCIERQ